MIFSPGFTYGRDCLLSQYSLEPHTPTVEKCICEFGIWTDCRPFNSRCRHVGRHVRRYPSGRPRRPDPKIKPTGNGVCFVTCQPLRRSMNGNRWPQCYLMNEGHVIDAVAIAATTTAVTTTNRGHAFHTFRHPRDPHRSKLLRRIQCDSFCDRSTWDEGSSLLGTESTRRRCTSFNAASIAKPHAIEQHGAELIGWDVDVAVITETYLRKKHADSCVDIDN